MVFLLLPLLSFNSAVYASSVEMLELLLQDKRVGPYKSQKKVASAKGALTPIQNRALAQKKHSTAKTIHLKHKQINQINYTEQFVLQRLNPADIAFGAVGLQSVKDQATIEVRHPSEKQVAKVKATRSEHDKESNQ